MEDIEGILRSVMNEADKKTKGESNPGSPPNADSLSSEMKAMMTNIQTAMVDSDTRAKATVARTESDIAKTDFFSDMIIESGNTLAEANKKIKMQADMGALEVQEDAKRLRDAAGGVDFQVSQIGRLTESQQNTIRLQDEKADILDDELTGIAAFDAAINMFRVGNLSSQIEKSQRKSAGTTRQIQQITQSQESFGRVNTQAASTINQGTIAAGQSALASQASIDESKARLNQVFSNGEAYARADAASGQEVKNLLRQLDVYNSLEDRAVRREEIVLRREQMESEKELIRFKVPAAEAAAELSSVNLSIAQLRAQLLTFEVKSQPEKLAQVKRDIKDQENRALLLQNDVNNIGTKNQSLEQNVEAQRLNVIAAQNNIDFNPTRLATAKVGLQNAIDTKNERDMRRAAMATNVRTGQAIAGIAIEPEDAVIMQGINSGGATGRKYDLLMEIAAAEVIGFDPATARTNLAQLGNYKPTKGTNFLDEATIIQNTLGATDATYKKPNTVEGVAAEYNAVARSHYKSKELNIATADYSNPLHAPSFAVLASKKSVSSTALYQKILKAKGMTETNPQTIMDAAMAGVLSKEITQAEAEEGIEAIFDQAAASNDIMEGGLARVGFDNQTTYNVRLVVPKTGLFRDFTAASSFLRTTASLVPDLISNAIGANALGSTTLPTIGSPSSGTENTNLNPVNLMDSGSLRLHFTKLMTAAKENGSPAP